MVTTCSPRNNDLVRSLGAQHVFDYRDKDVVGKIKTAVPNLHYVFDTIGDVNSAATASQAIVPDAQGYLCTVRPGKEFTENVTKQTEVSYVLVWTAFLKDNNFQNRVFWTASTCQTGVIEVTVDANVEYTGIERRS